MQQKSLLCTKQGVHEHKNFIMYTLVLLTIITDHIIWQIKPIKKREGKKKWKIL